MEGLLSMGPTPSSFSSSIGSSMPQQDTRETWFVFILAVILTCGFEPGFEMTKFSQFCFVLFLFIQNI